MSIATLSTQAALSGSFLAPSFLGVTLPTNANAAPPSFFTLATGNNNILAPTVASGFTVTGVMAYPQSAGSSNSKTFSGASGGAGFTGTALPFIGGVAAGGSFWVASAGIETLVLVWF